MRVFFFTVLIITAAFAGCSKKHSIDNETQPRQCYEDSEISNDDARRDTFEDFGEPLDIEEETPPKIKDYYRVHYYHFV